MVIIYFIITLSIIILVHEFGHFIAAKAFKVYVKEFSLGFGPVLLKKQGKETKYCLRALPFGGYVAMAGEEGIDCEEIPAERYITGINKLKRVVVMLAGIFMNILLAWLVFVGLYLARPKVMVTPPAVIKEVVPETPAAVAGLQPGDQITSIVTADGVTHPINDYFELAAVLGQSGEELTLVVKRADSSLSISVTPRLNEDTGRYFIGITSEDPVFRKLSFIQCFEEGTKLLGAYTVELMSVLGGLFKGVGLENLSGPVGILQVTGEQAALGIFNFVHLIGFLSLNVGFFNILPLPILDGGRVILIIIEAVINKPINKKIETGLMMFSLLIMVLLMVFASYNDILRLF